jgi:Cell wall-associated hydrolases (invasion-associated proteins)
MIKKQKTNIHLLIILLAVLLVSCSTTQRLEKKQSKEVYEALNLRKERKDNFSLYKEAASWLNVPHREGGLSGNGIDCSGLVYVIYKNVYGKTLERNSTGIMQKNCEKIGKGRLREGDLVFFNSGRGLKIRANINHVGIYLKDNKFLHTSTSRGVIVSDLEEDFFRKAWVCGGRVTRYK